MLPTSEPATTCREGLVPCRFAGQCRPARAWHHPDRRRHVTVTSGRPKGSKTLRQNPTRARPTTTQGKASAWELLWNVMATKRPPQASLAIGIGNTVARRCQRGGGPPPKQPPADRKLPVMFFQNPVGADVKRLSFQRFPGLLTSAPTVWKEPPLVFCLQARSPRWANHSFGQS